LASKFSVRAGIKAIYRQYTLEEFERSEGLNGIKWKKVKALRKWLAITSDEGAYYGTIGMDKLKQVQKEMSVQALSWEKFLEETGWRGPVMQRRN
jgi:hypothetical protein